MALQLGSLRNALLEAGATQEKADRAAEEVASYDNRISGVETRLAVLTWMAGANLGLTLLLLGTAFALWSKLGELGWADGPACALRRGPGKHREHVCFARIHTRPRVGPGRRAGCALAIHHEAARMPAG